MKKRRISFKLIYLIYILVLAALVTAAVLYVRALLFDYEASQPERHAQTAAEQLCADAASDDFWSKYDLPEVVAGPFEQNRDIKSEYLALFEQDSLTVSQTGSSEDELYYTVERNGLPLAEIKLKAAGPAVTKLAVLSMREWAVESVTPVFAPQDYSMTVPKSFCVQVNGQELTTEDGVFAEGEQLIQQITYTLPGLYLSPEVKVTDQAGTPAQFAIKGDQIIVESFSYVMVLPSVLTVTVDGQVSAGAKETVGYGPESDVRRHEIVTAGEPEVLVSDLYGNTIRYEGESFYLRYLTILADSRYDVRINGAQVPSQGVLSRVNPEYTHFSDFVEGLPILCEYHIAILDPNADISVIDNLGNPVELDDTTTTYDFTNQILGLDTVPAEVAAQVDVLQIAQNWSMFMTDDLPFAQLKEDLIAGSYQYEVAVKYATGIDIKYTSKHTLANPAFTENSVTNFTWITEDCFSVDISFVKHMRLYYGAMVDDPMNDRFYFVRYDDTDNGLDDPAWKLASMKEIV